MTDTPKALDDLAQAAHAWRRFRRMMGAMAAVSAVVVAGALWWLAANYGVLGWVAVLATIGGVGGSMMLASVLMGLMFLSSGTGHDESAAKPPSDSPGP